MRRWTLTSWLVLASTSLLACTGDDDSAADGGGSGDVEPRSGVWSYMGSAPVDDTCGFTDLYVDPPGQFTLDDDGDGTFTINDSQNQFDCELDGSNFACPERASGTNDVGAAYMLDAVVQYTIRVAGSFDSDTQMSGRQTIVVTCEGVDCATVEAVVGVTTPCGWAQDFTATAQ